MKIKNNTQNEITVASTLIPAGEYYTIQNLELMKWQNDSSVLSGIGSGQLVMNDMTNDITDVAKGINLLLGVDTTPKDSDGVAYAKTKITTTGWAYQLHCMEFETAQAGSLYSKKADGSDFGFLTLKLFKDVNSSMVECTDQADADANCVMTQIDWEPTHDFEIVGGAFKQLSIPSDDVRLWVVAVPDVPAQYGGSKLFASSVNLKFMGLEEGVKVDGRAPKFMPYSATYHSNKIRIILKHSAGFKHRAMMIIEIFKA
jgi:hypothetical protein